MLTAPHRWWVVLSGAGIAPFLIHGLSVTTGHFLGLTLPERPIAFAATSVLFLLFGSWLLFDGAPGRRGVALGVTTAVAVATATAAVVAYVGSRREHPLGLPPLESSPGPGGPPAGYCRSND
jgi:Ca2+/H+ antiporter, TMEM165/GDT1 family